MLTLQTIFASGWIQIVILLVLFYVFTQWVFRHGARSGYALGWLIGVFFIVVYGALFPRAAIQVAVEEPSQLTVAAVLMSSCVGVILAMTIIGITVVLQRAWFRQMFSTAGITAILVTMLFMMLMSPTQVKMGLTLASLAFAIVIAIAYMLRRAYMSYSANLVIDEDPLEPVPVSDGYARMERIREQVPTTNRL